MRVFLVQPPFVQLNAPYPAVHYLASWLRQNSHEVEVEDHSIELYRLLFSRAGLSCLFDEVSRRFEAGEYPEGAAQEIIRYLSYHRLYEDWIDSVVSWLSGADPAFSHRLASAVEFPRGARTEALLESRGGRPGPEDAPLLASLILEDLGDLITQVVDAEFGTVQYGERLGRSRDGFEGVRGALESSWLMNELYRPWLRRRLSERGGKIPDLVLVSLPFPGTLVAAIAFALEARTSFGPGAVLVFGGGYVSTELRGMRDPALFDYCDFLSFDAGYGSLASIMTVLGSDPGLGKRAEALPASSLVKTMTRRGGRIISCGFPEGDLAASEWGCAGEGGFLPRLIETPGSEILAVAARVERSAIRESHPDYRDLDPSRYLRPLDSVNPMHRLWSEAPWLKYRLAQGCYWSRCVFCDTELDYVRGYMAADLEPLFKAMEAASRRTGLYGIHFVDEALPMARLLAFAEENRRRLAAGQPQWHFWGNVRFDASWDRERIELLAASGLVAVSGGIEVATDRGLEMTDKGFDLPSLVRTLVAFRRAGILVHAYLIYGFPGQDERDIIESADFVRGLFATGLVDSAFWHRFVLTRHSRMLSEWKNGQRSYLRPIDRRGSFAANDLEFEGELAFDRFGEGLDAALGAWMEGDRLDRPAASWLGSDGEPMKTRGRVVAQDGVAKVESLIAKAEERLDAVTLRAEGWAFWTAGLPLIGPAEATSAAAAKPTLSWSRRGKVESLELPGRENAMRAVEAIGALAGLPEGCELHRFMEDSGLDEDSIALLRDSGLVVLSGSRRANSANGRAENTYK